MGRRIVFNVSKMGASHVKSGKPCQDYSLSWESDDKQMQVAIVCDGHGGTSYVRSDVGSKYAAEIALSNIQRFTAAVSPAFFLGKSAAVTARPEEEEDSLFPTTCKVPHGELTESQLEQLEQDKAFYAAVADVREQDEWFCRLFAAIYLQWLDAIQKDASEHPFTEAEKACLKNAKVVKAYGSTLMAFVSTPFYWFAFHIGDGKLMACDRNFRWSEPVPWDCNCFLNLTTSLCNSNPIPMFRYAFSGKGDFPIAVILGSDGLDDSWVTIERLGNFYSQTLAIFDKIGEERALEELSEYLPELSRKASQDDMSMAGIIDMDEIKNGIRVYSTQRKINEIQSEKEKKEAELRLLKTQCEQAEKEIKEQSDKLKGYKTSLLSWFESILAEKDEKENDITKQGQDLDEKRIAHQQLCHDYDTLYSNYHNWMEHACQDKEKLERDYDALIQRNAIIEKEALSLWESNKQAFEQQTKAIHEKDQ